MNEFQANCLVAVADLLKRKGKAYEPLLVERLYESYYRLQISCTGREIDVYIYEDEAGYFVDRKWHIREAPDFDDPQNLIDRFLADLERELAGESSLNPSQA